MRYTLLKSRKILLALLLFTVTGNTMAQYHSRSSVIKAYPVIGLTASQIEGDELKGFRHWGFTGGVGAFVYLTENERWLLSVEADVAQRGTRETTRTAETLYNITGLTLNYVDIPVMMHYTDPYGGMTIGLGLCYSRLVQQPHGEISYNPRYFIPDTSDMTFLRNDLSAAADFRFTLWRNLKLGFRVQYSLFPIKKDWKFTENVTAAEPKTYINDCYNFSISTRLLWIFGEEQHSKVKHKSHRR
jgi:hypothetical protein